MGISKDEIIDLASRYTSSEEITDFPFESDLFCILVRELPENKILTDEEGWAFRGYGICIGYTIDEEAKPRGKWLWMHFASLDAFPPVAQIFKLQPPHVVKGRFQNPERNHEIRLLKVNLANVSKVLSANSNENPTAPEPQSATIDAAENNKIVQFRRKTSK